MSDGVVYGDYYLLGKLAQGGMAEVFLAKSLLGGQSLLAVKRTLEQFVGDEDFVSMFRDEARIARGLDHENICRVVDEGTEGEQLYIVMEFIHGKDLKVLAQRGLTLGEPIPFPIAAFILARMAEALHTAHNKTNDAGESQNIVHRDVSPQNILISYEGVPKLIDFGVAKARDRLAKTQVGVVKGKFAYMSPEQAVGAEIDHRSDLFGLGVVLYALISGQLPFVGASDFATLRKVSQADYVLPERPGVEIPQGLMAVVRRALTRSPDDRYQSGNELARDLDLFLANQNQDMDYTRVSSYLRRLFREEYQNEMSRIRMFHQVEAPTWARQRAADRQDRRSTVEQLNAAAQSGTDLSDATVVRPMADLAAGYDAITDEHRRAKLQPSAAPVTTADTTSIEVLEIDDLEPVGADEFDGATVELSAVELREIMAKGGSTTSDSGLADQVLDGAIDEEEVDLAWNEIMPRADSTLTGSGQTLIDPAHLDSKITKMPSSLSTVGFGDQGYTDPGMSISPPRTTVGFDPELSQSDSGAEWSNFSSQFSIASSAQQAPGIADLLEPDQGYHEGLSHHSAPQVFLTGAEIAILLLVALLGAGTAGATYLLTVASDLSQIVEVTGRVLQ